MRIDLTLHGIDGLDRDVAVLAAGPTSFGQVRAALRTEFGPACAADGWCADGLPLRDDMLLGDAGLRTGARLAVAGHAAGDAGRRIDVVGGIDAGHSWSGSARTAVAGRDPACDLVLRDPDVSRRHLEITVSSGGISVRDLGSTHGTTLGIDHLDGARTTWQPGDLIRLGDTHLAIAQPCTMPATAHRAGDGSVVVSPRRRTPSAPAQVIDLPARVSERQIGSMAWPSAGMPALAGVAMAVLLGSPEFLAFALMSPLALLGTQWMERCAARRRQRAEMATEHANALIAAAVRAELGSRRAELPDAAQLLRIARGPLVRLWQRSRADPTLLRVRLGLGSVPSAVAVRTSAGTQPAAMLAIVPVSIDLSAGPLGLVGPRHVIRDVARWLVGQLAVLAAPSAIRFALIADDPDAWRWLRWLPHDVALDTPQPCGDALPSLIVVHDGAQPGVRQLDAAAWICLAEHASDLPLPCAEIVRVANESGTRLLRGADTILAERVDLDWAERVARALAPLVVLESGGTGPPPATRLSDVAGPLDPIAVAGRWSARPACTVAVLGRDAEGTVGIDLDRDGPHVLVGGTTGSGKSQLLRMLVAGLAAAHPPEDIAFVLVDYKGGAAFIDCAELPHVVGVVTDLDAHLTRRALHSLGAELRRRERLFAAAGVPDLAGHRSAGGDPALPRLVLVVDEFATLSTELPGFVTGLTSIAQRGRSLGLHLVLATQRPSGAVTADIRANCATRIALRVTDVGDSIDVIDVPDAASIPASLPGRAYLRAGDRARLFQVATADARAPDSAAAVAVRPLGPWRELETSAADGAGPTELQVLAASAREVAAQRATAPPLPPWLAPLPDRIALDALPGLAASAGVPIGVVDEPCEQRQRQFVVDLAAGHTLLFAGAARTGRTSALVTVGVSAALRCPPDELEIHVIDLAGELVGALDVLPHRGTYVGPDDGIELADLLLRALGNYRPQHRVLLLIDGWERFVRAADEWDGGSTAERLMALARTIRPGWTLAIAGDRTALASRLAASMSTRVLLQLPDRADYGLAGIAATAVPRRLPPGRGVLAPAGTELQLADAGSQPGRAGWAEAARTAASRWSGTAPGPRLRLHALPADVRLDELPPPSNRLPFALAAPRSAPVGLSPAAGLRLLVAGPPRSGRSTALITLLRQAHRCRLGILVAAPLRSPLRAVARELGVPSVDSADQQIASTESTALVLVDDSEYFADSGADELLCAWARDDRAATAFAVAARADDLARTYRGIAAEIRRHRCGLLLQPGPVDGDLLGLRLRRGELGGPPGRGVLLGDPAWGDGPVRVQVARS